MSGSWEDVFASSDGPKAVFFRGNAGAHACFSNFADIPVSYEGLTYRCSEGAYQAQKTLDVAQRANFVNLAGKEAKALGRSMELRPDWDSVKLQIMFNIVGNKFSFNNHLGKANDEAAEALVDTRNAVILEDTTGWKDNLWGKDFNTGDVGHNWLGLCLMLCRAKLTGDTIVRFPYNCFFNIASVFQGLSTTGGITGHLAYLYNKVYDNKLYIR